MTTLAHGYSVAPKRGAFIVFEGIDRCGKTTQSNILVEHLRKKAMKPDAAEFIRFPNRTSTIGQLINSYLASAQDIDDHTIHLLFSANRWEEKEYISKRLLAGTSLICDRYAYSGVAFTSAKGLDTEWCKSSDRGLPRPDCVIYLDMPVDDAAKVSKPYSYDIDTIYRRLTMPLERKLRRRTIREA
jgi:dTMP kinase